jgi:hypothetical protein
MKTLHSLALVLSLALAHGALAADSEAGWISLFNGKDLEGWTIKVKGSPLGENFRDTFRVENGLLKVSYDKYPRFEGQFGHIFYREKFSNYRFRVQYRFTGKQTPGGPGWAVRNSGIMLHCQAPESMTQDQEFPVSIEVQLLGGDGKTERTTANMCSPGTHIVMDGKLITQHCVNSRSKTFHGDQWVTAEVEVYGSKLVRHIVNGEPVMEYQDPQYDPKDPDAKKLIKDGQKLLAEGYIALQAESHPVEFRKIEILPLKP